MGGAQLWSEIIRDTYVEDQLRREDKLGCSSWQVMWQPGLRRTPGITEIKSVLKLNSTLSLLISKSPETEFF